MKEPASINELYNLVIYGLCTAVIALALFIRYMIKKHDKMIEKITDKMDERQEETNKILSKHASLVETIKTILEHRR